MTSPQEPTATATQEAESIPQTPVESRDLDAEIVRDLEVDQASDDVRGGNCPYSLIKGQ